jgi:hypothetical protein
MGHPALASLPGLQWGLATPKCSGAPSPNAPDYYGNTTQRDRVVEWADYLSIINRFSSRRQRLDPAFLAAKLKGAKSCNRIAGYFRSSIFELVGEEIADIPRIC